MDVGRERRGGARSWPAWACALAVAAAWAPRAAAGADHLEEAAGPLGPAEVEAAGLAPLVEPRSLGFTGRPVWVRLRLENPGPEADPCVLSWDWPLVDRLDLWWRDGQGAWARRRGGLAVAGADREVAHSVQRHYRVFQLAPGQALDVYARVQTRGPMLLDAETYHPDQAGPIISRTVLWLGLWGGALAVLVATALWTWLARREPVHLHYALFGLTMGGYQAVMSGVLPAALRSQASWAVPLEPLLGAAVAVAGVVFCRAYVEPRRRAPGLDRALVALAWLSALAALPLGWGDVLLANRLTAHTGGAAIGGALLATLALALRGDLAARRFLVGFGPFALAGGWYVAMLTGLAPPHQAAQVAFQATFLFTGLALALALSAQRREEEARNRAFLEAAVADRSRALDATVARLAAAQRLEAVGRLAAGVAHDFNNLLTGIAADVGELQRELAASPEGASILQEVRELTRRGGELTRSLLLVARRQPVEPIPVDLNQLVGELARLLERLVKGVRLEVSLAPEAGTVLADPGQLEQVVLNLVLNARDACDGDGRIQVSTGRVRRSGGPDGRPDGEWVCLAVTDDGAGMDEATRARIFEPFFTTKAEGRGTGVGLSVVDGVARAHGGFVEVVSAPGQGASFTVWLPAAGAPRQDPSPALTPPPGGALTGSARSVT